MDFKFNVNKLFVKKINKVTHTLVPADFSGNLQELSDVQMKISKILDDMGEASAIAQCLKKSVTSASRLQGTDHIVYLLVDSIGNGGLGTIVGFLKTGSKNLFLFDEVGSCFQLRPRCVLDFYIHESKQRMGLGRILYQHMLEDECTTPEKLAIDRPSNKFLQFLQKHYGVHDIIGQNNKFVVFKGFFDDVYQPSNVIQSMQLDGFISAGTSRNNSNVTHERPLLRDYPKFHSPAARRSYGRHAAAKPIIHDGPALRQNNKCTGSDK